MYLVQINYSITCRGSFNEIKTTIIKTIIANMMINNNLESLASNNNKRVRKKIISKKREKKREKKQREFKNGGCRTMDVRASMMFDT